MSTGNILIYEGGAKLADLEYAKKVGGNATSHDMRTVSECSDTSIAQVLKGTGYIALSFM